MFTEYRNSNRKTSEYSDNVHENAFIQFSKSMQRGRERQRINKMHYVVTFEDILLNMKLESLYLEETTPPMKRYSSPTRDHCFHCAHDHNQSCCLYVYDTDRDKMMYSKWKSELEADIQCYQRNTVPKIPEALSGNTTPRHFPGFTYNNPEFIETRIGHHTKQNIMTNGNMVNGGKKRWFQQFYYPLFAMDIIPTISGIPIKHGSVLPPPPGSVLRPPPEIRPLSTIPPPPMPSPPEPSQPKTPKICCNAHILVKQHKTTNDQHNHYHNNNRYYHYHHHHYNNYNNFDNQQHKKFIPTKYFYNQQTTGKSNKWKKNYKPQAKTEVPASDEYHRPQFTHNKQNSKNRYYKKKQNYYDDIEDHLKPENHHRNTWDYKIGQISTNMIHEIPYMYFY